MAGIFYGMPLIIGMVIGILILACMVAARAVLARHRRGG